MKITFARHGQTDWNKAGRLMGQTDLSLNEEGLAQAEEVAKELKNDFDVIFSSSLKRSTETTAIVNKKLKIPVIVNDLILERNFGSLAGKTWDEINVEMKCNARDIDKKQQYDYRPFGGESAEQVKERLDAFISFVKASTYKKPIVVCHGGIIRMLHFYAQREFTHIQNGSVYEFDL